jgi:hypothetical protein
MFRAVNLLSAMALGAALAQASPFWVTWDEGWPDQQGWTEGWSIPAEKSLDDGLLYIDSTAQGGYDGYYQNPATVMPGPGETFRLFWRARIDEASFYDPGVIVRADDHYSVAFGMGIDFIESNYEPDKWAPFEPGVFHDFLLESSDMRSYNLFIDTVLAMQGTFFESLFPGPYVAWGDLSSPFSLTAWDALQYGIIPEPSSVACVLLVLCCIRSPVRLASPKPRSTIEGRIRHDAYCYSFDNRCWRGGRRVGTKRDP